MEKEEYPDDYEAYLYEFHATRDYFECHELLEAYWKAHPGDGFGETWVGLIQLAVGAYHYRRGNLRGAAKMFAQARRRLAKERLDRLGLDGGALVGMIDERLAALGRGVTFADPALPIADARLLARLRERAASAGLGWALPSGTEPALVHRHALRDRSDVVAARAAAAEAKRARGAEPRNG
ncbi:hypothetical protein SAMN02799624_00312 [Paenibacillus sp. UNC496MF]|uniref:DUF309 domain-containing protein n=1 Tax=Paenibacillus sp. UNC496MF TaxID=1502753 RepID=UPI0008E5333D|nr:DUF309 domain-containing protein [Paenibacillus sp. UNC496MF]SFI31704.1 hypothetical protein SAMN02799624_00312 [Paenibacillus sp. UNC496MF]